MACHQADAAEQAAWRSSGKRVLNGGRCACREHWKRKVEPRSGRYSHTLPFIAIGMVSNSRLCDEAKPGQILITARVLTKVEHAVKVEPVDEFELKGIRRLLAAYNV